MIFWNGVWALFEGEKKSEPRDCDNWVVGALARLRKWQIRPDSASPRSNGSKLFYPENKTFYHDHGADLIGRLGKLVRWRRIGTQRLWSFARRLADEGQRRTNPALPMAEITSQSNSPTNNRFFQAGPVRSDILISRISRFFSLPPPDYG